MKKRTAYKKELSKKWIAEGKCPNCGAHPPAPRRKRCERCLDTALQNTRRARAKNPEAFRSQYHELKKAGLCVSCGVPGKTLVTTHCVECRKTARQGAIRTKQAVMQRYGGACFCCGEVRVAFLTLDHINDDGAERRKAERGGGRFYEKLLKSPVDPTLRVACYNCNCGRRATGVCPHIDNSFYEEALERGRYERRQGLSS